MREKKKHGFSEFVCPRISDSTLLGIFGAQLLFLAVLLLCGCRAEANLSDQILDEFTPYLETQISIDFPNFGSCPDGWSEEVLDAGHGYEIPYCKPPNLSDGNPDSPLAPTPPNFLPCPSGWTEVEDTRTGLVLCQPYGPDGPEDCDGDDEAGNVDKIHFPGEPGCVRIGTECPEESPWATNLPGGREIVYVQAGADFGEQTDGSQDFPFGNIGDAIEHAGEDAIIALSKGIYDEPVVLQSGIVLWGACVAETEVTSSIVSETEAVITTEYADTEVRNLRITGQKKGVFVNGSLASAHIEDVVVNSAHVVGMFVLSGFSTVRNSVVRDTQSRQSDRLYGTGLIISAGASVEVARSVVTNNRDVGIYAGGVNTELKLYDALVNNTQHQQSDGLFGRGLNIEDGASVEVARSVFNNNREVGIYAEDSNTKLNLYDVLVSNTQSRQSDRLYGTGLVISAGASVEVARSVVTNNRDVGIHAYYLNTKLKLHNVLVSDTQGRQSDGEFGRGLSIQEGASAEVARSVFTNNRDIGVSVYGTNTELTLHDVEVSNTQGRQSDGESGRGLSIQEGPSVEVARSVFTNNRDIGISTRGTNTELTLHDVLVSNTQHQQSDGLFGRGLNIEDEASVEVSRSVFTNNRDIGVFVYGTNTELKLHDVLVSDTQSRQSDGKFGRALHIQTGVSVEVSRSVFINNRDVGIYAAEIDTNVTLNDVIVAHTNEIEIDDTAGTGIGSYGGAHIEMDRFVVTQNAFCGVQVAFGRDYGENKYELGGELRLSNGIISQNEICGINVQTDTINLDELSDTVHYFENSYNNLDTALLLTPKASIESLPLDL